MAEEETNPPLDGGGGRSSTTDQSVSTSSLLSTLLSNITELGLSGEEGSGKGELDPFAEGTQSPDSESTPILAYISFLLLALGAVLWLVALCMCCSRRSAQQNYLQSMTNYQEERSKKEPL